MKFFVITAILSITVTGIAELQITSERLNQPYKRIILKLNNAPPQNKGLEVTLGILGDKIVQSWAITPLYGSLRMISQEGNLTLKNNNLKGTMYILIADPWPDKSYMKSREGGWWSFEIDAKINNTLVSGTWSCKRSNPNHSDKSTFQGNLTGKIVTREDLEKNYPLIKESDYPCWRGRFGNGTAIDTGWELVENLIDAEVLWVSEERNIPGTYHVIMGGFCGPIVYNGCVYLSYVYPNGPTFDENQWKYLASGPNLTPYVNFFHPLGGEEGLKVLRRRVSVEADDVILCIDAQTGLTKWKQVFPARAFNPSEGGRAWSWAKNGPFTVPCIGEGKVFTVGGLCIIYALDADTGKLLWETPLPSAEQGQNVLKKAIEEKKMAKFVGRLPDFCTCLAYADGCIVANHFGKAIGYDAKTGQKIWGEVEISNLGSGRGGGSQSGTLITLESKQYLIMGPALIDPRNGKVLWTVPEEYYGGREKGNPAIYDDIVVFGNGNVPKSAPNPKAGISAWKITKDGGKLLWALPPEINVVNFCTPAIYKGHVYIVVEEIEGKTGSMLCIELKTGRIVGKQPTTRGEGKIASIVAGDGRVFVGQQGASWWRADPNRFERLCKFPGGDSSINNQSSHPQALCGGRLYVRGDFNIVCWDLRKK